MSVITKVPEKSLWLSICKEFDERRLFAEGMSSRPPTSTTVKLGRSMASETPYTAHFSSTQRQSMRSGSDVSTPRSDFDPKKHTPVFCTGQLSARVPDVDALTASAEAFDPSVSHPAAVGYVFLEKPSPTPPESPAEPPNSKTCSPREYLEAYVFPILIPALEAMLHRAREEKCFERKRTLFNSLDFLTEYLYCRNPNYPERADTVTLSTIPFVAEHWKEHPRPPPPKSLVWTDEEAAIKLQSAFRGFVTRKDPEIQELRTWQREWRERNEDPHQRVKEFWDNKMPDGTPQDSNESLITK